VGIAVIVAITALLSSVFGRKKRYSFPDEFFYIYLDGGKYKASADSLADQVQKRSGAGLIRAEKSFQVVCFLYDKIQDVDKVKASLKSQGLDVLVGTLKIEKLNRKSKRLLKADSDAQVLIEMFPKYFSKIYDLICDFDTHKLTESEVYVYMRQIYVEFTESVRSLNGFAVDILIQFANNIKVAIYNFLYGKNEDPIASSLKQICFFIVYWYNDMILEANSGLS